MGHDYQPGKSDIVFRLPFEKYSAFVNVSTMNCINCRAGYYKDGVDGKNLSSGPTINKNKIINNEKAFPFHSLEKDILI